MLTRTVAGSAWKGFQRLEAGMRCVKQELGLSVEKARGEQQETGSLTMKRV